MGIKKHIQQHIKNDCYLKHECSFFHINFRQFEKFKHFFINFGFVLFVFVFGFGFFFFLPTFDSDFT